jgi:diaminopropionate ammonia-lyase
MSARYLPNPLRVQRAHESPARGAYDWHRTRPGYVRTPLVALPELAAGLGFATVRAKDESSVLGLNSFKALGASWAVEQILARGGERVETLVAATDGNHGRAVASVARARGLRAEIFVPRDTPSAKLEGIRAHGGMIEVVPGGYDVAVAAAAARASAGGERVLLVSDTAVDDADPVPRLVIDGYSTLFLEIDDALREAGEPYPDLVLLPIGVGGLAAAGVRWARSGPAADARIVGVEPATAACVFASIEAGRPTTIADAFDSEMVGLNAGTPSLAAWDHVRDGIDGFLTITDEWAPEARRHLTAVGIDAGPTGLAGLSGLLALASIAQADLAGPLAWFTGAEHALVVVTEGAD